MDDDDSDVEITLKTLAYMVKDVADRVDSLYQHVNWEPPDATRYVVVISSICGLIGIGVVIGFCLRVY